jgi:hypothetical protein
MKNLINFLKSNIDLRDIHVYIGILLITAGCFLIYQPAALLAPGVLLLWLGVRR